MSQLAASGGLRIESGGAGTDTRFEEFQQREFAKQFVEQARRDGRGLL
jgi:hypothetical protein